MGRNASPRLCVLFPVLLVAACLRSGNVAHAENGSSSFYSGKTITLLVAGSAGGGYDEIARLIARFLAAHVPGSPSIVVRDMPGAGGLVAANYLFNSAEKDGTVLGLIQNSTPLSPLFGIKEARFDATKFNWLGTPSTEVALTLVWHSVSVNSIDDLRKREITMGSSSPDSTYAFYGRLLNVVLGTKLRIVNGYNGLGDILLAIERGEIDGTSTVFYSSLLTTRPRWVPDHLAKPMLQIGPEALPEFKDVPFVLDLIHDPDDKLLMEDAVTPMALGRPLLMPPGVPSDRVDVMRQALTDTFRDPAFIDAANKIGPIVNITRTGEQLQDVIDRAYSSPSRVVERLQQLQNSNAQ
jgi:tripartite-type tricarboxylate transporter receptor subunit TctC